MKSKRIFWLKVKPPLLWLKLDWIRIKPLKQSRFYYAINCIFIKWLQLVFIWSRHLSGFKGKLLTNNIYFQFQLPFNLTKNLILYISIAGFIDFNWMAGKIQLESPSSYHVKPLRFHFKFMMNIIFLDSLSTVFGWAADYYTFWPLIDTLNQNDLALDDWWSRLIKANEVINFFFVETGFKWLKQMEILN